MDGPCAFRPDFYLSEIGGYKIITDDSSGNVLRFDLRNNEVYIDLNLLSLKKEWSKHGS